MIALLCDILMASINYFWTKFQPIQDKVLDHSVPVACLNPVKTTGLWRLTKTQRPEPIKMASPGPLSSWLTLSLVSYFVLKWEETRIWAIDT